MVAMLDNGKILDSELYERVSRCYGGWSFCLDAIAGRLIEASFQSWDGEHIVLYKDKHQYELGVALGVIPAPAPGLESGFLMLTPSDFQEVFGEPFDDSSYACERAAEDDASCASGKPGDESALDSELDALLDRFGLSIIYDYWSDRRFSEVRSSISPTYRAWKYEGDLPKSTQRLLLADTAIKDASRFYGSKIFRGNTRRHTLTNHSRAARLMESLALGFECRPYPDYPEDDPFRKWRTSRIQNFLFSATGYAHDASLDDVSEGYRFYSNLSVLWEELVGDSPICLDLDWADLKSDDKCNEAMGILAKAIDAHSYVDAYCSGVPLEDILA